MVINKEVATDPEKTELFILKAFHYLYLTYK